MKIPQRSVLLLAYFIGTLGYTCHNAIAQPLSDNAHAVRGAQSLYVDQDDVRASDENEGSAGYPLRTIQRALNLTSGLLAHKSSVRIRIGPGTYREGLIISGLAHTDGPSLTLEARNPGKTIISGSDVWGGWKTQNGLLSHEWPYDWGESPKPPGWPELAPIVRRREMVFVNGISLEQSLTLPLAKPGTFAVDGNTITINPPADVDGQAASVEIAVRPILLKSQGHTNHLTLRGLVFQHANTGAGYGVNAAALLTGSDIAVTNCKFNWNNWVGLSIATADHVRLSNVTADHNGENGISMWRVSQFTASNLSASGNNWRGAAGGFLGWDTDAVKALSLHDAQFENFHALDNQAGGMWLDTDIANIVIRNATVSHNLTNGFFFEKSQGPIVVRNSTIARNHEGGVQGSYSTNISLLDDLICGNESTQVRIAGRDGAENISDYWTGQKYRLSSAEWTIASSKIITTDSDQSLLSTYLVKSWPEFADTLISRNNLWAGTIEVPLPARLQGSNPKAQLLRNRKDGQSRFAGPQPGSCPK